MGKLWMFTALELGWLKLGVASLLSILELPLKPELENYRDLTGWVLGMVVAALRILSLTLKLPCCWNVAWEVCLEVVTPVFSDIVSLVSAPESSSRAFCFASMRFSSSMAAWRANCSFCSCSAHLLACSGFFHRETGGLDRVVLETAMLY